MKRIINDKSSATVGHTLIELVFVVIIIALIAGIVIPRMGLTFTVKMKAYNVSRKLVSNLRYTRRLAITNNENYRLHVNSAGNEYTIYDSENDQVGNTETIDSSITVSADKDFIFEPFGNASAASDTGISISADGNQYDVTVTVATGRVELVEA